MKPVKTMLPVNELDVEDLGVVPVDVHRLAIDVEDARIRSKLLAGRRELGVLAFAAAIVFLAILAAAMLATPRVAPDSVLSGPTVSPGLPGAPRSPHAVEGNGVPLASSVARGWATYCAPTPTRCQSWGGDAHLGAVRWAGTATWYCSSTSACTRGYGPSDLVAAIDSDLGIPKGATVVVRAFGKSVTVVVRDVCACPGERLIDLTSGAFRRLAPLEYGVIPVTIEVVGSGSTLPPTDVEPVQ